MSHERQNLKCVIKAICLYLLTLCPTGFWYIESFRGFIKYPPVRNLKSLVFFSGHIMSRVKLNFSMIWIAWSLHGSFCAQAIGLILWLASGDINCCVLEFTLVKVKVAFWKATGSYWRNTDTSEEVYFFTTFFQQTPFCLFSSVQYTKNNSQQ